MMKPTVLGMNCKAITICRALPYHPKKKSLLGWGQRHKRYLKEHRKATYTTLLTSVKLNTYLADVEEQAQEMFTRLMKQRAKREGITEKLKAENQMEWVGRMNALCEAITETVNAELIFV